MEFAFDLMETSLGIPALLTTNDVIVVRDEKSILTYLVTIHNAVKGFAQDDISFGFFYSSLLNRKNRS
jgi:hypothetical protein